VRIYSIEELCYFLYHHVYMIDEDMFCDDLFDWIGSELKLQDRALKLKQLKQQKADLKTIVTVILCSADYFTENEIKGMLKILDQVAGMPLIKRNCIKANSYLENKRYLEAASEYEKIINSTGITEITPEEYGNIYHNLAVAKVHITGLKEASRLFAQAYERNRSEESLRQYLYSLRMCNNEEVFASKLIEYAVDEDLKQNIQECMEQHESEAKSTDQRKEMEDLMKWKNEGKMSEFYKRSEEMIEMWKAKVR